MPIKPDVEAQTRARAPRALDRATAVCGLAALVLSSVAIVAPGLGASDGGAARASAVVDVNAIGLLLREALAAERLRAHAEGPRFLFGPGVLPRGDDWAGECGAPLSSVLRCRGNSASGSDRACLPRVPIDPWARAYVVVVERGKPGRILVVSAGQDGVVQSHGRGFAIAADDIGVVLDL